MKTILKIWLPIMGSIAVGLIIFLTFKCLDMTVTYRLSVCAAILLILHLYEEERIPGGFGYMYNVLKAHSDVPDRYPMSPFIAMIVDVLAFLFLFVPPLFFSEKYWLGLTPMFLMIMEVFTHSGVGFFIQRRKGMSIYTPGLVTALLMGAIGISYIIIVISNQLMNGTDWLCSILYFVLAMIVCLVLPEKTLPSKSTIWKFDHRHFLGFYKKYSTLEDIFKDGNKSTTR